MCYSNLAESHSMVDLTECGFKMVQLRPSEIRYCQDSIRNRFREGCRYSNVLIGETLDKLIEGKLNVDDIPPISAMKTDDKWISADNRRLWIFKSLELVGKCKEVPVQVIKSIPLRKRTSRNDGESIDVHGPPGGKFYSIIETMMAKVENLKVERDKYKEIIHGWKERYAVSETENRTKLIQIKDLEKKLSTYLQKYLKFEESKQTEIKDLERKVTLLQKECKERNEAYEKSSSKSFQIEDLEKKLSRSEENNQKLLTEYKKLLSESRAETDSLKTKIKYYETEYKGILAELRAEKQTNMVKTRALESQLTQKEEYLRKLNSKLLNKASLHGQENGNRSLMQSQSSTETSVQKSEAAHMRQDRGYASESKYLRETLQELQRVKEKYQRLQISREKTLQENKQLKEENESLNLSASKHGQRIIEIRKLTTSLSSLVQDE